MKSTIRTSKYNICEPMRFGIAYPRGRTALLSRTVPNRVGFLMESTMHDPEPISNILPDVMLDILDRVEDNQEDAQCKDG